MIEAYRVAIQTAFIAIASRIVGSAFRVGETFNRDLQKAGLVMKPEVVIKREAITMGLAWCFALITNIGIAPVCRRLRVSKELVTFLTSLIGTATAETVARTVAYRNLKSHKEGCAHPPAAKPMPALTMTHSLAEAAPHAGAPVHPAVPAPVVPIQSTPRPMYSYNPYWGGAPMMSSAFPPVMMMGR